MNKVLHLKDMKQSGAVLIVSLMLLLVMTIIGVTAMQTTVMQQRMAGNSKDLTLAFQAAEAATRVGESWLSGLTAVPDTAECPGINCVVWDAYGAATALYDTSGATKYTEGSIWDDPAIARSSALADMEGVPVAPDFVVEFIDLIRDSQNMGQQQDLSSSSFRNIYAVTARGTGGNASARAFVQTNFARRF